MSGSEDVVLIGGGVIGLSLAWELARRGRGVCVLEANSRFGREASWAGAGMLPAAPAVTTNAMDQFMAYSRALHEPWAKQLQAATDIDTGFHINGALYLARTPGERASLRAWQADCNSTGVECHWLETQDVQTLEPALAHSTLHGATRLPDEAQLRNPDHLRALVHACRSAGVKLQTNATVTSVDLKRRTVAAHERLRANQICFTAGPWSRELLEDFSWTPDIYPVRGQMILFRHPEGRRLLQHTINEGPRYLVPRQDGRVLAGSTEEEVGFVKETTPEAMEELTQFALTLAPFLADCPVERRWAGLRPAAFDGFPYLGKIPGVESVFLAAGHFRNGLNLSTGTAVLMAQLMCDESPDLPLDRFRPGR